MVKEKVTYKSVLVKEKYEGGLPEAPLKAFGARHVQVLLLFLSLTVGYMMRAQLSVSLVAMTNSNKDTNHSSGVNETGASKWSVYRTYDWHKPTQEMILFAFFVGYTAMMIPMGLIAQKFGGKIPILVALGVNGVVSILTPWVPLFSGWLGICACRLLQGLTQAAFYPSIHTILGKWAPISERGRLSTYVYTGSQFGTILVFQTSGFLAGVSFLGWPSIYWMSGLLSLGCCGLLAWLGAATPQDCPNITTEELVYIIGDGSADVCAKKRRTPWKSILTSTAVWGMIVSHAGSAAGYIFILTEIPTYMNKVLAVDIKKNGLYSSLPYIAMYLLALLFAQIADWMMNNKIMSIANIRRTANTIAMAISSLFLIAFSYVTGTLAAVILLVVSLGLHSAVHVGFHVNQIDLAPNFAGTLMSLGNMIGNLTSLLVPVLVSNVVQDDVTNQKRWQTVFLIIAGVHIVANAVFVVFVKGDVQPWNFYGDEDEQNDTEKLSIRKNSKLAEMKTIHEENNDHIH